MSRLNPKPKSNPMKLSRAANRRMVDRQAGPATFSRGAPWDADTYQMLVRMAATHGGLHIDPGSASGWTVATGDRTVVGIAPTIREAITRALALSGA